MLATARQSFEILILHVGTTTAKILTLCTVEKNWHCSILMF